MKRFFYMALAAVFLFTTCKEEPVVQEEALSFSVTPASLSFKAEDTSSKLVTITTNGNWTATPAADWIRLDKNSGSGNGSITVTASINAEDIERSANILLIGSKGSKEQQFSVTVSQDASANHAVIPAPAAFDGNKRASTTYQLLIYSFADSDGDGWGDIRGIIQHLDDLEELGVSALWLSPAHPSDSYHGYDVTDYFGINPRLGSESDFRDLIDKARTKNIRIYMDYVLNHSGKGHPWFQEAISNASSPYRNYYFISSNPSADYKNFPMLKGTSYQSGEWKQATGGSPKLTVTETTEDLTEGNCNWNLYLWDDAGEKQPVKFVDRGNGSYYAVFEINGKLGILVRKYMNWDAGSKFGAQGGTKTIQAGTTVDLVADGGDMWFTGNGRYKFELTDVSVESLYYMGCFSDWMPDLNYGDLDDVTSNACFKDMAASADKWIKMGIGGLRLDAVKHICGGIASYNHTANRKFLKAWYEHCNTTYKNEGGEGEFFMVAEEWDDHSTVEKYYYASLPSCFEFDYWGKLKNAVNGNAGTYVSSVMGYIKDHEAQRPGTAITSIFMTNHDQDRAAEELGKDVVKEKQAAAMMLTTPGKPFIYQGEELGYWGNKSRGDEYVRTPIKWTRNGSVPTSALNGKVDNAMLTANISVEAQKADENSLLNVYRTWSRLRNTYPALAEGAMSTTSLNAGNSVVSWYMSSGNQKLLVIHNCGNSEKSFAVSDSMEKPIALLGTATTSGNELTLGAHSSVVFEL